MYSIILWYCYYTNSDWFFICTIGHNDTYLSVLNEEVTALPSPVHRQYILLFTLALPDQKVPITLQQFLDFDTWNGTMVPTLLTQRLLKLRHRRKSRWHLGGIIKHTTLHNRTSPWAYYSSMITIIHSLVLLFRLHIYSTFGNYSYNTPLTAFI